MNKSQMAMGDKIRAEDLDLENSEQEGLLPNRDIEEVVLNGGNDGCREAVNNSVLTSCGIAYSIPFALFSWSFYEKLKADAGQCDPETTDTMLALAVINFIMMGLLGLSCIAGLTQNKCDDLFTLVCILFSALAEGGAGFAGLLFVLNNDHKDCNKDLVASVKIYTIVVFLIGGAAPAICHVALKNLGLAKK
eukprot:jgi/Bigna1/136946/aug1.36_g11654